MFNILHYNLGALASLFTISFAKSSIALSSGISTLLWFMLVVTVMVFVHELGHFLLARACNVQVETFSIGFGPSLFKWKGKNGVLWRIAAIPLGGYVKMLGDENAASMPNLNELENLDSTVKAHTFYYKSLWQKALIVAAGPIANYILAIVLFAFLTYSAGVQIITSPKITKVLENSPAAMIGLKEGDYILEANNHHIDDFRELQDLVISENGKEITLKAKRDSHILQFHIQPHMQELEDMGHKIKVPFIGIACSERTEQSVTLVSAVSSSFIRAYSMSRTMLKALYQIATGDRSIGDIGGPIRMAQYSAKSGELGLKNVLLLIAVLSLNLGLINLLPIPMLDGGHLFLYIIEYIRGAPLSSRIYTIAMRLGLTALILLMAVAFYNDLKNLLIH